MASTYFGALRVLLGYWETPIAEIQQSVIFAQVTTIECIFRSKQTSPGLKFFIAPSNCSSGSVLLETKITVSRNETSSINWCVCVCVRLSPAHATTHTANSNGHYDHQACADANVGVVDRPRCASP